MIVEEAEEIFGILVEHDVFVGAQAVEKAITAGSGFAFGGARAGRFLGVLAVGVDLRLGQCAGFVRFFHIGCGGRVWPDSTLMLGAGRGGFGWHFVQVVESNGERIFVGP